MSRQHRNPAMPAKTAGTADAVSEVRREAALLKTGALQDAILNSANFSSIATDEKGVIQLFNVGAERMLGYTAIEVVDKITPADISDPQEVIARANRRKRRCSRQGRCRARSSTATTSRASPPTRKASSRSSTSAPSACWATRPPR